MSVSNHRKCAKCGKTRAEDMKGSCLGSILLAYCTSLEFLQSLHSSSKVLCGRHFNSTQFYDNNRQKLSKFAVPDSTEVEQMLNERENIFTQTLQQASELAHRTSKIPILQIENIQAAPTLAEPCTSSSIQQTFVEVKSTKNIQNEPSTMSIPEFTSTKQLPEPSPKKSHGILGTLGVENIQTAPTLAEPCTSSCIQQTFVEIKSTKNIQNEPSTMSIPESTSTKQLPVPSPKKSHGILRTL